MFPRSRTLAKQVAEKGRPAASRQEGERASRSNLEESTHSPAGALAHWLQAEHVSAACKRSWLLGAVVALTAAVLATGAIGLLVARPVVVAEAVRQGDVQLLVRELAVVLRDAFAVVLKYL